MLGFRFSEFKPEMKGNNKFEQLLNIFQQLLLITAGDVGQALSYMSDLDRQYQLTDDNYGMADFIEDLKRKGYITEENQEGQQYRITAKSEQSIRKQSLDEIFGKLKRTKAGYR